MACLQPRYNLLDRAIETNELPYSLARRLGVLVFSPLARGLLSGQYGPDAVFQDARAQLLLTRPDTWPRVTAALDRLRPIAARHSLTLPQLAVRWVLTHPAVTCAITGVKTSDHIRGATAAADGALPADEWHRVAGIMAAAAAG